MDYYKARLKFQENYIKKLKPFLDEFDKTRKNRLKLAIFLSIASVVSGIGIIILYLVISIYSAPDKSHISIIFPDWFLVLEILLFIAFPIVSFWIIKKDFENKLKKQIMPTVCSCFGDLKWEFGSYCGRFLFCDSKLVDNFNSAYFDDVFKGKYLETNFEIIEANLTEESDCGDKKSIKRIFNGIIIKLDFNNKFKTHTIIRPNSILHFNKGNLKHTELEDVVFEEKYDVYTDDEIEARCLITPVFMNRLNEVKKVFKCEKVSVAFYQNNLLIALHGKGKDYFNLGNLFKTTKNSEQFFELFDEILSVYKLIDYLKVLKI